KITTETKCNLTFKILPIKKEFTQEFYVLSDCENEGILGNDFLVKNCAKLDYESLSLVLNSTKITFLGAQRYVNDELDTELLEHGKICSIQSEHSKKYLPELVKIINQFPELGLANIKPVKIYLTDNTPVIGKPYPISIKMKKLVNDELNKLLNLNVIVPSKSKY
ncbi:hypothetical protein COBT_003476, partial [Conglomerata obtusa]